MSIISSNGPVTEAQREILLDILRGLALFGILIVNIEDYSRYYYKEASSTAIDAFIFNLNRALFEGSFYPLFSFLFGVGFAVWMDSAKKSNQGPWRFGWRAILLFLFGCILFVFIEQRSILYRYALLSFPLLFFYKASTRILWIVASAFLLLYLFFEPISEQFQTSDSPAWRKETIAQLDSLEQIAKEERSYASQLQYSSHYLMFTLRTTITNPGKRMVNIFLLFLLGIIFWRQGLLKQQVDHIHWWKKIFWWCLPVGLVGNAFVFINDFPPTATLLSTDNVVVGFTESIANPALTFFYISASVLLLNRTKGKPGKYLNAIAATGRMGFSNYFLQCIVLGLIMLPYAGGQSQKLSEIRLMLIVMVIYLFQLAVSVWWLNRFSFGPMEWLWRSLTYLKLQPFKKRKINYY